MIESLQPGSQLGPYEILEQVGSGALGTVYRARQSSLDRIVALKVLDPDLTADTGMVQRFVQEARTAALLRHPHIVAIFDVAQIGEWHVLAMEFLPGRTLNRMRLPLEPSAVTSLLHQLCDAAAYAHRHQIVHRDIKPENVVVDDFGRATLTDFGLAQAATSSGETPHAEMAGTPEFMSPEQASGRPVGFSSDVYSLGLVCWFLLNGRSPFREDSTEATLYRQIHDPLPPLPLDTPPALCEWIEKCTAKDPAARFATGAEAMVALDRAASRNNSGALPQDPIPSHTLVRSGAELAPTSAGSEAMAAVLRGETSLAQALIIEQEHSLLVRDQFRQDVTALSLDVVRSSALKAPGETIIASFTFGALRRYVQSRLVDHHVLDYTWSGDGILAIFSSVDEAVKSAEEIIEGLPAFNASRCGLNQALQVRIGLHSGPVLITGAQSLGELTSPTLDMAGRLQKSASPNGIRMSRVTQEQLSTPGCRQVYSLPGIEGLVYGMDTPGVQLPAPRLKGPPAGSGQTIYAMELEDRRGLSWAGRWAAAQTAGILLHPFLGLAVYVVFFADVYSRLQRPNAEMTRLFAVFLTMLLLPIMFIIFGGSDWILLPMWLTTAVGMHLHDKRVRARSTYVSLEQFAGGGWSLPEPARVALAAELCAEAPRLGFQPEQLVVRVSCDWEGTENGPTLVLRAEAFDRVGDARLARAFTRGPAEEEAQLARELARRLCSQMVGKARSGNHTLVSSNSSIDRPLRDSKKAALTEPRKPSNV